MAESAAQRSIGERIEAAERLFERHRGALERDPTVRSMIRGLRGRIHASGRVMHELGVNDLCRECDEREGGSCCGRGIEDRFGPALLLMNLLMGASLPRKRPRADSCFFLGTSGCVLVARHVLCVNYLCRKIEDALGHESLLKLQETTGREMEATFLLHEAIKQLIRSVQ